MWIAACGRRYSGGEVTLHKRECMDRAGGDCRAIDAAGLPPGIRRQAAIAYGSGLLAAVGNGCALEVGGRLADRVCIAGDCRGSLDNTVDHHEQFEDRDGEHLGKSVTRCSVSPSSDGSAGDRSFLFVDLFPAHGRELLRGFGLPWFYLPT